MSTLVINPTYQSLDVLYEADLDSIRIPLQNFLNTTQVDGTNFAPNSLITSNLQQTVQNALVQTGMTQEYYGTTLPEGYLWCDGSSYNIDAYPELFNTIVYQFGGTIGSTFMVPDRRGRVAVGNDAMGGTAAGRLTQANIGVDPTVIAGPGGGNENLTAHTHPALSITTGINNTHTHTFATDSHTHDISQINTSSPTITYLSYTYHSTATPSQAISGAFSIPISVYPQTIPIVQTITGTGIHQHTGVDGATDTGTGTNPNLSTVQPSIFCNYIIKT